MDKHKKDVIDESRGIRKTHRYHSKNVPFSNYKITTRSLTNISKKNQLNL